MKTRIILLLFFSTTCNLIAQTQTIKGRFLQLNNHEITLMIYDGITERELVKTTTNSLGEFSITYPKSYVGAALLQIKNITTVVIILNNENFSMQWDNLQDFNTLKFNKSPENDFFAKGVLVNQGAESKLSGLRYLLFQYDKTQQEYRWLEKEIIKQEQIFTNYLNQLPKSSYALYYLKIRKLISDFPLTANRYIERMPQHELDFNALNFNAQNLHTSGLLKDLLEGYFRLMESHQELDKMYTHINTSTNAVLHSLVVNTNLQQEVAQHLFNFFEKRSLFQAAEYIALSMLHQSNCLLSEKSTNLFEQYRKLAIGKTAPDINLNGYALSTLKNKYKLIVFGASWCPNCQEDYPKWKEMYDNLKKINDLEIIYISIDTDKKVFEDYYKDAPFITFNDTKGWETQAARDYCVFATPTYILIDKELKILQKIKSPAHLAAWLKI